MLRALSMRKLAPYYTVSYKVLADVLRFLSAPPDLIQSSAPIIIHIQQFLVPAPTLAPATIPALHPIFQTTFIVI